MYPIVPAHSLRRWRSPAIPTLRGRLLPWAMVTCLAVASAAHAEDSEAARRAAVERYLRAAPAAKLLDDAIAEVASQVPAERRARFVADMRQSVRPEVLEEATRKALVKVFTADEIQAMADFYASTLGSTALAKMGAYTREVTPVVMGELARYLDAALRSDPARAPAESTPARQQEDARFVISGNEVYDRKTDRTWQRCNYGQTWDAANKWCSGTVRQMTVEAAADQVAKDRGGWRLPDIGELVTLLEAGCHGKTRVGQEPVFAEVKESTFYLSASPHSAADTNMAAQCFGPTPSSAGLSRRYLSIVRLVRSGK